MVVQEGTGGGQRVVIVRSCHAEKCRRKVGKCQGYEADQIPRGLTTADWAGVRGRCWQESGGVGEGALLSEPGGAFFSPPGFPVVQKDPVVTLGGFSELINQFFPYTARLATGLFFADFFFFFFSRSTAEPLTQKWNQGRL